jgi:hypothetical protein
MPRRAHRRLTTDVLKVDLRDLKDHGWFLRLPGGHAFRIEDRVVIDWHRKRFAVAMTQTEPHYGGQRFWFCCPCCAGRARILYAPEFDCRTCSGLLHPSTRQAMRERAISRAVGIRRSLGGSGSLLEPFPPRPAGMRRASWLQLWSTCHRYEHIGSEGAAAVLARLSARLIRT